MNIKETWDKFNESVSGAANTLVLCSQFADSHLLESPEKAKALREDAKEYFAARMEILFILAVQAGKEVPDKEYLEWLESLGASGGKAYAADLNPAP